MNMLTEFLGIVRGLVKTDSPKLLVGKHVRRGRDKLEVKKYDSKSDVFVVVDSSGVARQVSSKWLFHKPLLIEKDL